MSVEVAHEGGLVQGGAAVDQGIDTDRGLGRDLDRVVKPCAASRAVRAANPCVAAQWSWRSIISSSDSAATPSRSAHTSPAGCPSPWSSSSSRWLSSRPNIRL